MTAPAATVIWKIADIVLNLIAIGISRKAILGKIKTMEEAGATPADIVKALSDIADAAIAGAQAKIDALPGSV